MSNGAECCALQICCPPAEARLALIAKFQQVSGYDADGCTKIVDYLRSEFALAPKSFQAVIDDIADMAKHAKNA
jgi:hypothetical protein